MGINPTQPNHKAFTFDGTSSRDYGVYITGEAVFNAPQRDVQMVDIPGRNGAYALDKGNFNNITVKYPASIVADNETDFAEAVSDLRNFLCSKTGYCRLEDEYNPDEYRMAIYKSGLEVEHDMLIAGEFDITFECKPQRWLTSGEELVTIGEWGETETASGEIATFEADSATAIKTLTADIEPIQDTSGGDPSPTNICPISGRNSVEVTVTDDLVDPTDTDTYTISLGTTVYGGTLDLISGELTVTHGIVDLSSLSWTWSSNYSSHYAGLSGSVGKPNNQVANCIAEKYATDSVSNVLANVGRIGIASNATPPRVWVSTGAQADTPTGNLVYELATPTTTQLTPQQVQTLLGTNNVWSTGGDVTVEYGQNPMVLVNPTLFPSRPMLETIGYGGIDIGGQIVTVDNVPIGIIKIASSSTGTSSSLTQTLDVSNMNASDAIEISNAHFEASYRKGKPEFEVTHLSIVSVPSGVSITRSGDNNARSVIITPDTVSFAKGTSGTWSKTVGISVTVWNGVSPSTSGVNITCTLTYDGDSTLSYSMSFSAIVSGAIRNRIITSSDVFGDSTISALGNPTYIDLDIGEAYNLDSGTPVSVNNAVSLPAELPTLPSGDTTITFDNTFTQVDIVPRWWKV